MNKHIIADANEQSPPPPSNTPKITSIDLLLSLHFFFLFLSLELNLGILLSILFFLSLCKEFHTLVILYVEEYLNNLNGLVVDPCLLTKLIWVGLSLNEPKF